MCDHKGSGVAERKTQALNGRVEIIILDKNKKHKNKTKSLSKTKNKTRNKNLVQWVTIRVAF